MTNQAEFLNENIVEKNFIPSYVQKIPVEDESLYLFFHIPKTGGMTLTDYVKTAFELKMKKNNIAQISCKIDKHQIPLLNRLLNAGNIANGLRGIWSTHHPVDVINSVNTKFKMITIIRDPVDRLVSSYSYVCMRNKKHPNASDFLDYTESKNNQNQMCKVLLGAEYVEQGMGKQAADLLEKYFFAYCDIGKINTLISYILSVENLPNIIGDKANVTEDQFKYNGLTDHIYHRCVDLNKEDYDLYLKINGRCKIPKLNSQYQLNDRYVIYSATQGQEKYGFKASMLPYSKLTDEHKRIIEICTPDI